MKLSLKRGLSLSIFIAILSFLFVFGIFLFKGIFIDNNSDLSTAFIGGFVGAFFAFLFSRLADGLNKIYTKYQLNREALVILERSFNDINNQISDNLFVIDGYLTLFQRIINNKKCIHFTLLSPINYSDRFINLTNIYLINDLESLRINARKVDDSIETFNRGHDQIKSAFIKKDIDFDTYKFNIIQLNELAIQLKVFLQDLAEELFPITAKVRILLKDEEFLTTISKLFFRGTKRDISIEEIQSESRKLKEEINRSGLERAKKIQEISEKIKKEQGHKK